MSGVFALLLLQLLSSISFASVYAFGWSLGNVQFLLWNRACPACLYAPLRNAAHLCAYGYTNLCLKPTPPSHTHKNTHTRHEKTKTPESFKIIIYKNSEASDKWNVQDKRINVKLKVKNSRNVWPPHEWYLFNCEQTKREKECVCGKNSAHNQQPEQSIQINSFYVSKNKFAILFDLLVLWANIANGSSSLWHKCISHMEWTM